MIKSTLLTMLGVLLSSSSIASNKACEANTLRVITDDGPPHMIQADNSGIDLDIARKVFYHMCKNISVSYAPLRRTKQQVMDKKYDAFLPTFFEKDTDKLFYSTAIIDYKPTLFTLTANNISLNTLADIQDYNVTSFQGATGYFGDEYAKHLNIATYREMSDMSRFPSMLLMNRTEIVVLDYYIFYYYLAKFHPDYDKSNITAHSLIPSVSAHVGFHNKLLRDNFNKALEKTVANGEVEEITRKYIGDPLH